MRASASRLDALGDDPGPQPWAKSTSDRTSVVQHRVAGDAVDDAPVELDDVRRGQHDVPQRREAGTDVVDRELHAARAQRLEAPPERLVVVDLVVLGELEEDPVAAGSRSSSVGALGGEQRAGETFIAT